MNKPSIAVLYHYFHPDDVVSGRVFAEFCAGLTQRGWQVEAWPCTRGWHDESGEFPPFEIWQGVDIQRVWRPRWRQASGLGRILNAGWMLTAWSARACRRRRSPPDVLLMGTDPVLSVLVAPVVRRLLPRTRIVHWCFDLYPEGPIAEGMLRQDGLPARTLRMLLTRAYAVCDLVADLGSCMRDRLEAYGRHSRKTTLVPWALSEPEKTERPDPAIRRELFGDAPLGLLYSGNFGRAHSCTGILKLARQLHDAGVHFCFGIRGNRAEELHQAIRPDDVNISLVGFAPEVALARRLAAADVHLVSLRPEWTGIVVPSKFFGSLAAGRPVVFSGSRSSAVARWIVEHQVGWVLDDSSQDAIADELRQLATAPTRLAELQRHCHRVYRKHFCRDQMLDEWDRQLRALLVPRCGKTGAPCQKCQGGQET